jgi:hypothetical protein
MIVKPDQFEWLTGSDLIGRYEIESAKYFATCFCKNCGTNLPWKVQGGRSVVIPVGTLDEPISMQPTQNIHWASKADWFHSDMDLPCFDELP